VTPAPAVSAVTPASAPTSEADRGTSDAGRAASRMADVAKGAGRGASLARRVVGPRALLLLSVAWLPACGDRAAAGPVRGELWPGETVFDHLDEVAVETFPATNLPPDVVGPVRAALARPSWRIPPEHWLPIDESKGIGFADPPGPAGADAEPVGTGRGRSAGPPAGPGGHRAADRRTALETATTTADMDVSSHLRQVRTEVLAEK